MPNKTVYCSSTELLEGSLDPDGIIFPTTSPHFFLVRTRPKEQSEYIWVLTLHHYTMIVSETYKRHLQHYITSSVQGIIPSVDLRIDRAVVNGRQGAAITTSYELARIVINILTNGLVTQVGSAATNNIWIRFANEENAVQILSAMFAPLGDLNSWLTYYANSISVNRTIGNLST